MVSSNGDIRAIGAETALAEFAGSDSINVLLLTMRIGQPQRG